LYFGHYSTTKQQIQEKEPCFTFRFSIMAENDNEEEVTATEEENGAKEAGEAEAATDLSNRYVCCR
jgi:hypothetical protein